MSCHYSYSNIIMTIQICLNLYASLSKTPKGRCMICNILVLFYMLKCRIVTSSLWINKYISLVGVVVLKIIFNLYLIYMYSNLPLLESKKNRDKILCLEREDDIGYLIFWHNNKHLIISLGDRITFNTWDFRKKEGRIKRQI